MTSAAPDAAFSARVETLLGARALSWTRVQGGYTPAARWRVETPQRTVFVKAATEGRTAAMLRREAAIYQLVSGPFMPRFIGWEDDSETPLLIIEDLAHAFWPPPWTRERYEAVRRTLDAIHACEVAAPTFEAKHGAQKRSWTLVAADPEPFLRLGLVDARWLTQNLPPLLDAEAGADASGAALTHWDVRSDNMCLNADGALMIDWTEACRANPKFDFGAWAPSLAFEGGPAPEEVLPNEPEIAAWVTGYFAARAGLPIIENAPRVRLVQQQQLSTALPWVIRALNLPTP